MSSPFFSKLKSKTGIGIILLVLAVLFFPLLKHYFGTFYLAPLEEYKKWYPDFYFIVYPVVKAVPFVFLLLVAWLLRDMVMNFLRASRQIMAGISSKGSTHTKTLGDILRIWFPKAKVKQFLLNMLVLTITTAIVLVAAEFALRAAGMKPGLRLYSRYFQPVDSLYMQKGFIGDSNGIFCISPDARDYIRRELSTKNAAEELPQLDKLESPEVYAIAKDFLDLRKKNYQSAFKTFLEKINVAADTSDAEFFAAVKEYVKSPINSNGFKSIEFKKYATKRKSILLLGDSFTWGHSSSNKTNCFADGLLTKGYVVYNAGITGTDPAQYLQIAKILVPLLQPDHVVVNAYMGNDIIHFERKPEPYVPVFYCTNAGHIISCPEGIYFYNPQEAYDHILAVYTIPDHNRFNRFCSKTVIGTLAWRLFAKLRLADTYLPEYIEYYTRVQALTTETPYSNIQIAQIKEITETYNGSFLLTVIPALNGKNFVLPDEKQSHFTGLDYFVPPVKLQHYEQREDGHYNDLGHQMHAEFIDSLIRVKPAEIH